MYHMTRRKLFYFVNKPKNCVSATKSCISARKNYICPLKKNCKSAETIYDILKPNSNPNSDDGTPHHVTCAMRFKSCVCEVKQTDF